MPTPVQALLCILSHATDRMLARQVQFLKAENEVLRSRLPERIKVTHAERRRLLKYGRPLGSTIRELITIVKATTFYGWVRESDRPRKKVRQKTGRPKKPIALRQLILKIARETGWGYTRVLGELRKLTSQKISRQTVVNIMREAGLEPGPKRGEKTWDEFIRMHGATLWQCDFFTKKSWTKKGLRDLYVLVFLNIATRKVIVTPATAKPNREWVAQQVAEIGKQLRANDSSPKLVFHDSDAKFGKSFAATLRRQQIEPRRLRPRSPNMNAFVERWIQSIKVECLDHFIAIGEAHLNHLVEQYVEHYHAERPHQGLDNRQIISRPPPDDTIPAGRAISCRSRLGGLLKHYERRAA